MKNKYDEYLHIYVHQFQNEKSNTNTQNKTYTYVFIVTMLNCVSNTIINSYLNVFSVEIGRIGSELHKNFIFRSVFFFYPGPVEVPTLISVLFILSICVCMRVCMYVYVRNVGDPWKMYLNQSCMLCSAPIKAMWVRYRAGNLGWTFLWNNRWNLEIFPSIKRVFTNTEHTNTGHTLRKPNSIFFLFTLT